MNMIRPILILGLFLAVCALASCDDGCVECTGASAPQQICKGDYQNASDYQNYVSQYEAQGGTCE